LATLQPDNTTIKQAVMSFTTSPLIFIPEAVSNERANIGHVLCDSIFKSIISFAL
jgi:hypothetical protein